MDATLLTYLLEHPESIVVVLAVAYWARKEFAERNGANPAKNIARCATDLESLLQAVEHHRKDTERMTVIAERIERKIDIGTFCPIRRSHQED